MFRSSREQFFVLELGGERDRAALVSLDDEMVVRVDAMWHTLPTRTTHFFGKPRLVISLGSECAYTATAEFVFPFSRTPRVLAEQELENALSYTMQRMLNEHRARASEALGSSELDTVLVSARALHMSLDGVETHYPPGSSGKRVDAVLEVLFTTRDMFNRIAPFLSGRKEFFFAERGRAELAVAERVFSPPIGMVSFGLTKPVLFLNRTKSLGFAERISFPFHPSRLMSAIREEWGISLAAARGVYAQHGAGTVSPAVQKLGDRLLAEHRAEFLRALKCARFRGSILTPARDELPFVFPLRYRLTQAQLFSAVDTCDSLGLRIADEGRFTAHHVFSLLAPIIECRYDKSDPRVNHWLARRIHWVNLS